MILHGDDFTFAVTETDSRWLANRLTANFEIKTNFLGPDPVHSKQLRILNRIISWANDGITYEPDQRHAEIIISTLAVKQSVTTPGSCDEAGKAGPPNIHTAVDHSSFIQSGLIDVIFFGQS